MKTFFRRHKAVMLAFAGVLLIGVVMGLLIGGAIRLSMTERAFSTVADAGEPIAPEAQTEPPAATAEREPASTAFSLTAEEIRVISQTVQSRRRYIIPVRSQVAEADNRYLWTEERPDARQIAAAREAADRYAEILYGKTFFSLTDTGAGDATVRLFQDTEDCRDDILRVTDYDEEWILTLNAADMQLISADLLIYPDGEGTEREKENLAMAEKLGYAAKPFRTEQDIGGERIYQYRTETDVCLAFSYIGNRLWQVGVYPSEQAMFESEYFLADIQFDYGTPAYPENFVKADPPKRSRDEMVRKDTVVQKLTRLYKALSGEALDASCLQATFYRDESGAREDCWELTGGGFYAVVSAYSRNVIRFTCSIPCKDLLDIPYERMGGEEYRTETEKIARLLFGALGAYGGDPELRDKTVKGITTNAVADGHVCTMDVELADGTWYECCFRDGVLKEIWYYADEGLYWAGNRSGWVADSVYVNAATGKLLIPEYRTWDGDLHVIHYDE